MDALRALVSHEGWEPELLIQLPSRIIDLSGAEVYDADTSSSACCLREVSSKDRCT